MSYEHSINRQPTSDMTAPVFARAQILRQYECVVQSFGDRNAASFFLCHHSCDCRVVHRYFWCHYCILCSVLQFNLYVKLFPTTLSLTFFRCALFIFMFLRFHQFQSVVTAVGCLNGIYVNHTLFAIRLSLRSVSARARLLSLLTMISWTYRVFQPVRRMMKMCYFIKCNTDEFLVPI